MKELLDDFIAETRETLQAIEGELIAWERHPGDRETLDGIFRFVHTVKGSCGFLDLPRLTRLSHAAEDALDAVRQGKLEPTSAFVTAVLAIVDRIAAVTDALDTDEAVIDDDAELITALKMICDGTVDPESGVVPKSQPSNVASEPRERRSEARGGTGRNRSVRLSLDLLDHLMSGVSDMVLARNEMARRLRETDAGLELDQLFSRLSSSIAEMRDSIGLVRLQPMERLFASFPRLVRDLGQDLDKDIVLELVGGDVEIDREMIELVRDPLTHILRNAVDHGIENKTERASAGKTPRATIALSAQQAGNQIVIEVIDDGRGIDTAKLAAKAIASGVTTAEDVATMSQRQKLELIFAPGLSTANKVTDLSGRGVGMDIVRHGIEQMGGTIELRSRLGQGLRVQLRLPLTLSIMAGLIVRAANMLFAIPRSAVVEILSVKSGQVRIDESGGAETAAVRGARMPFVRLTRVMGCAEEEVKSVIVVRPAAGRRYALGIGAVLDHEELVVKPAPPLLMGSGIFGGLTLPDSGRPIMLLDAAGIAEVAGVTDRFEEHLANAEGAAAAPVTRALIFRCLTGVLKAIRLSVLDRMEEVPAAAVRNRGGAMRLSHKGRHGIVLGLQTEPDPEAEPVKLLRLTDGRLDAYIAVADMLDIVDLGRVLPSRGVANIEGVIDHEGSQIELIEAHAFLAEAAAFAGDADLADAPLCYLERDESGWMEKVLKPLIEAAGYRVSHDPQDRGPAIAELLSAEDGRSGRTDRAIYLHDMPGRRGGDSVYRYDRQAILEALARRRDAKEQAA
tara:strand:- start:128 stop:2506 length:2379 start_codon:yes stop_codon:yes gene_type:complete